VRNTRQRDAIRSALARADRPLSPQEIHEAAGAAIPRLGIATVYRTIRALQGDGEILPVHLPAEAPRYELSGKGHHHHFHCRRCGKVFEMHGCLEAVNGLAPEGFRVEGHELTLYGRCRACGRGAPGS
jgi:Fur family ferric uptake transcriptional regulator